MSPELEDQVLRLFTKYIRANHVPNATKIVGILCGLICPKNPEKRLKAFVSLCIEEIEEELANGASSKRSGSKMAANSNPFGFSSNADGRLHWYQYILVQVISYSGDALSSALPALTKIIRKTIDQCQSRRGYKWAFKLLRCTLQSLLLVYPKEASSLLPSEWDDPNILNATPMNWGSAQDAKSMEMEWHVPLEQDFRLASSLLEPFYMECIQKMEHFASVHSKDDLAKLMALVRTCSCILPLLKFGDLGDSLSIDESISSVYYPYKKPLIAHTNIPDDLNNIWKSRTLDFEKKMLVLSERLIESYSDDLESNTLLVKSIRILITQQGCHVLNYNNMNKLFHGFKTILKRNKETSCLPRFALVKRMYMYHHDLMKFNASLVPTTENTKRFSSLLFKFSVSKYSLLRKAGQYALSEIFHLHPRLIPTLFEEVKGYIINNEHETDAMKGAMFVLRQNHFMNLFFNSFKYAQDFFLLFLNLKIEEKVICVNLALDFGSQTTVIQ